MKHSIIKTGLIAGTLLLAAGLFFANVNKSDASGNKSAGSPAGMSAKGAKDKQAQAASKMKGVDINSASKAELKTLPGIGDAEADKIIAGRPYPSKAFLVTRNIIPRGIYEGIRKQIIARQK